MTFELATATYLSFDSLHCFPKFPIPRGINSDDSSLFFGFRSVCSVVCAHMIATEYTERTEKKRIKKFLVDQTTTELFRSAGVY
jgi:hypothetical protein